MLPGILIQSRIWNTVQEFLDTECSATLLSTHQMFQARVLCPGRFADPLPARRQSLWTSAVAFTCDGSNRIHLRHLNIKGGHAPLKKVAEALFSEVLACWPFSMDNHPDGVHVSAGRHGGHSTLLSIGVMVSINGLQSAAGLVLNGQHGTIVTFNRAKGRYGVRVDSKPPVLLAPANLAPVRSIGAVQPCLAARKNSHALHGQPETAILGSFALQALMQMMNLAPKWPSEPGDVDVFCSWTDSFLLSKVIGAWMSKVYRTLGVVVQPEGDYPESTFPPPWGSAAIEDATHTILTRNGDPRVVQGRDPDWDNVAWLDEKLYRFLCDLPERNADNGATYPDTLLVVNFETRGEGYFALQAMPKISIVGAPRGLQETLDGFDISVCRVALQIHQGGRRSAVVSDSDLRAICTSSASVNPATRNSARTPARIIKYEERGFLFDQEASGR